MITQEHINSRGVLNSAPIKNISVPMLSVTSMNQSKTTEESGKMMDLPRADDDVLLKLKNDEVPPKRSSTETKTVPVPVHPKTATASASIIESALPEKAKPADDTVAVTVAPTLASKEADVAAGFSAVKKVEGEVKKTPATPVVVEPQPAKKDVAAGSSTKKKVKDRKAPAALPVPVSVKPETTAKIVPKKVSKGKKVGFSVLQMREYPILIGDNPAVSRGVPLTIDWAHDGEVTASIDEYEYSRGTPRSMLELRLPPSMRTEMMKRLGFSAKELMVGTKAANIVRFQRRRTIETLQTAAMEEFLEKSRRAILNATIMRGRKRREREYLEIYKTVINESKEQTSVHTYVGDSSFLIPGDKC